MSKARDILVKTPNPAVLDQTLQQMGAALVGGGVPGGYREVEGCYVARVFGDPGFVKFAMQQQGYAEVVRELEELV